MTGPTNGGRSARDAYADVRENILGLRTSLDTTRGFVDTVRNYLDSWEDQSQIHARLETIPAGPFESELTPLAELQLLRIVQEALANVRKHSGATDVSIVLCQRPGELEVTVVDDGKGFNVSERRPLRVLVGLDVLISSLIVNSPRILLCSLMCSCIVEVPRRRHQIVVPADRTKGTQNR